MDEEQSFLAAIRAAPDDAAARLVYADWLEDRGDPRAELVRALVGLSGKTADDPAYHRLADRIIRVHPYCPEEWLAVIDAGHTFGRPSGSLFELMTRVYRAVRIQFANPLRLVGRFRNGNTRSRHRLLADWVCVNLCDGVGVELTPRQREWVVESVVTAVMGRGPLEWVLGNESATTVVIRAPWDVVVEEAGQVRSAPFVFENDAHVQEVLRKLPDGSVTGPAGTGGLPVRIDLGRARETSRAANPGTSEPTADGRTNEIVETHIFRGEPVDVRVGRFFGSIPTDPFMVALSLTALAFFGLTPKFLDRVGVSALYLYAASVASLAAGVFPAYCWLRARRRRFSRERGRILPLAWRGYVALWLGGTALGMYALSHEPPMKAPRGFALSGSVFLALAVSGFLVPRTYDSEGTDRLRQRILLAAVACLGGVVAGWWLP